MLWPTLPHPARLRENSQVGGEVLQQIIRGCKREMALWNIQESGQGSAMTILRGRENKGKIVHLPLANRGHECLGKHLFWLPPIGFRNHLPRALFSVNLHLHNQKLLLPHSEPQSSFIPGSLPFLNNLGPFMYAFIWNFLQRLWYAGVSEVPK